MLRALAEDLRRGHPNLAEALHRWESPAEGIRQRLRAVGPLPRAVLFLMAADLLWLTTSSIWACR